MWNFQDTFETRKQSIISAFSICMTEPLSGLQINIGFFLEMVESKRQRYINKLGYSTHCSDVFFVDVFQNRCS